MWETYQTAKTFNCRPSELLCIEDRYAAYCLDVACGEFGRSLENELSAVEGKNRKEMQAKSARIMARWMDQPQQFRSPMATKG